MARSTFGLGGRVRRLQCPRRVPQSGGPAATAGGIARAGAGGRWGATAAANCDFQAGHEAEHAARDPGALRLLRPGRLRGRLGKAHACGARRVRPRQGGGRRRAEEGRRERRDLRDWARALRGADGGHRHMVGAHSSERGERTRGGVLELAAAREQAL
eukprot:scaffold12240_cov106-Isochrysis_galbana.AAC.5